MRGRTARARPRRRAQMQRRRRQVTQTERGKNGTPFNYSLAQARSHLSPPPLHPSLYLIPLLGTCFYYSGSNVARMRKGRGGRRGCPFLGNKGFVARSSFLLFPPILVLTRARREGSIYGGEREGEHRPLHIILQSFLAFRISLFSSRRRRYFIPDGVRMVGQDFLEGKLN